MLCLQSHLILSVQKKKGNHVPVLFMHLTANRYSESYNSENYSKLPFLSLECWSIHKSIDMLYYE